MKCPVIGVMPLVDENKHSLWMIPEYMAALIMAGGNLIMLPLTSNKNNIMKLLEVYSQANFNEFVKSMNN